MDRDSRRLSRRRILAGSAALSAVAIAGCTGNGDDDDGDDDGDDTADNGDDATTGDNGGESVGTSFAWDGSGTMSEDGFEMSMSMEGAFDGDGNWSSLMDMEGVVTESASIDGTRYTYDEMQGCTETDDDTGGMAGAPMVGDPTEWTEFRGEPDTTETIDGEEMDVYIDESDQHDEVAHMYVDGDGYLQRLEVLFSGGDDGEMTLNFHSQGDSIDIERPGGC